MIHQIAAAALSVVILIGLVALSMLFDDWIDRRQPLDRYDGDVADWVAIGNLYTIGGWVAIVAMWIGWRPAAIAAALLLLCFVFSGLPMYFGEAQRSRNRRKDPHRGSD